MDKSIIITAEMIALESMNPSQLLNAIPTRLPKFMDDVKGFVHSKIGTLSNFWGGTLSKRDANNITRAMNYYALSHFEIFVPTGMRGDYIGFAEALQEAQGVAGLLMSETLRPTTAWLGEMLGRPETMASIRESHFSRGLVFHDLDSIKIALAKRIDGASNRDVIEFSKVFKNNNEFESVVAILNTLNQQISAIDRKEIENEVNVIVEMMDRLMVRMRQDPETYKLSGVTMQSMAKVALNLAQEVEFFAAYYHLLQTSTTTMQLTMDKIRKAL